MQPINIRRFRKISQQTKRSLRHFLTRTENNPPKDLDIISQQIDKEVWKEIDCLSCANCCKNMSPTFNFQDLRRISAHFNMRIKEFKEKWLYFDKDEDAWMNVRRPCQFLDRKTNMCSIYEIRPADCAGFPHLVKKDMKDYMHLHRRNIVHCPATYKWVEKLKERILLSKFPVKSIETKTSSTNPVAAEILNIR
ncbi:MAG: YkgJ family cysteine cluster protein [Bacteroidota bacterium]|nr:YkgJ family cysteine cluster protein [Bacteroidota bacterium]